LYFTDRGIEELDDRRGQEQVSIAWLAERLRDYVDEHPNSEATIDSLASWLARLDEEVYEGLASSTPGRAGAGEDEDVTARGEGLTDIEDE
jgi:hypothetical protein